MKFRKQQAIYLQIGEHICEEILGGTWAPEEKIPSVREMAVSVAVNPNTVMRTYADLQDKGVIYNQRGIGYFVSPAAPQKIVDLKKAEFTAHDLPRLFRTMDLLNIPFEEVERSYRTFRSQEKAG